jgi:hypothetical protein
MCYTNSNIRNGSFIIKVSVKVCPEEVKLMKMVKKQLHHAL